MEKIKILIADDMEAHRRRLERIVKGEKKFLLVGTAENGYETVAYAITEKPDIILLDIEMEDKMAGIRAASEIHKKLPDVKIIILTIHQDNNIVFAAFQSGIVDYVIKSASKEEIVDSINAAVINASPIRPIIAEKIRHEFARIKKSEDNLYYIFKIIATLTPSEIEVLKLLCNGQNRREIATERSVELETIKKQISSILKKFGMTRTKEVIQLMDKHDVLDMINQIS